MESLKKGVLAAKGFKAASTNSHIKENSEKDDLALIYSEKLAHAAGVYTKNAVKADCIYLNQNHLLNGLAQAVIVNSGNANACAKNGYENAEKMAAAAAEHLGIHKEDVAVCQTGVIGVELPIQKIEAAVKDLVFSDDGSDKAAKAIMTTDTKEKEASLSFVLDGKECFMGGICKGSGMIHPNMGTMLSFVTTDAAISSEMLQKALSKAVKSTFNRVSVDGDTSTNDTCLVFANGLAGNTEIKEESADYNVFYEALHSVMESLAIQIAADGEGASKLIEVKVQTAKTEDQAETLALSVGSSSLVKAAMFGSDANWGRILCAMGYSGAAFDQKKVDVTFTSCKGSIEVYKQGNPIVFDEVKAKEILSQDKILIDIQLHEGDISVSCWGCDLTYEYVHINGDYRS